MSKYTEDYFMKIISPIKISASRKHTAIVKKMLSNFLCKVWFFQTMVLIFLYKTRYFDQLPKSKFVTENINLLKMIETFGLSFNLFLVKKPYVKMSFGLKWKRIANFVFESLSAFPSELGAVVTGQDRLELLHQPILTGFYRSKKPV
jgi:hypothetical protein